MGNAGWIFTKLKRGVPQNGAQAVCVKSIHGVLQQAPEKWRNDGPGNSWFQTWSQNGLQSKEKVPACIWVTLHPVCAVLQGSQQCHWWWIILLINPRGWETGTKLTPPSPELFHLLYHMAGRKGWFFSSLLSHVNSRIFPRWMYNILLSDSFPKRIWVTKGARVEISTLFLQDGVPAKACRSGTHLCKITDPSVNAWLENNLKLIPNESNSCLTAVRF